MSVWNPVKDPQAGYLFSLSDSLDKVDNRHPDLLHPVSEGVMIVASDYSGQHKQASHEAYSFLIVTDQTLKEWLPLLEKFRKHWLPDNRRISFKKLNEPVRWRALPAFLQTVGNLSGNLITILVDRRVGSFMPGGPEQVIEVFPDCFAANANLGSVEKMFRLASFVALIISGLRREDQESNWISDHDEALDSDEKREGFARLATCLTFGLTRWRQPADHLFGTTESPFAPYWSEDLAAVADLAAGAYCQMSGYLPAFLGKEAWSVRLPSSGVENRRARAIGDWLATSHTALKHVLLRLEQVGDDDIRASAQFFASRA
jgi:hypothetical protein